MSQSIVIVNIIIALGCVTSLYLGSRKHQSPIKFNGFKKYCEKNDRVEILPAWMDGIFQD